MPRKEIRYACPYCDSDYATEDEAQECFESHYEGEVYKLDLYYCVFCGFEFQEEQDCREHEIHCRHRHEPVPEEWRCCDNCELCTLEMRRTLPCPAYNFAPSHPACSEWRQVRK